MKPSAGLPNAHLAALSIIDSTAATDRSVLAGRRRRRGRRADGLTWLLPVALGLAGAIAWKLVDQGAFW